MSDRPGSVAAAGPAADPSLDRSPDPAAGGWAGVRVCVAGIRVVGSAVAPVLAARGASVVVVDGRDGPAERERAAALATVGVRSRLGDAAALPAGTSLLVVSPGFPPRAPIVRAAETAGVPVWGDVELAWRLRPSRSGAPVPPWLGVTGTNGKTTTVRMLVAILEAAGLRATAAGNIGTPLLDAALADPPYDVLAVELSSFQLHYTSTVRMHAGALLNLAPDHLDWHGSVDAYARDKARIWRGEPYAVFNADDPLVSRLAAAGPRARGFTLAAPGPGQLGVVDGALVDSGHGDTADAAQAGAQVELARVEDVHPAAPHNVANALAAAALARALDRRPELSVPLRAVRAGLRGFRPEPHRIAHVATVGGVSWVDDSKATNPHAAQASLRAYPRVVWIAGGLAKGATFDDLVAGTRDRLRAVVLLGRDREVIRDALARHAPEVPVIDVPAPETGAVPAAAMDDVVTAAAGLAQPGDTVLLAPACASMDMFRDYAQRGDAFAAAVRRRLA